MNGAQNLGGTPGYHGIRGGTNVPFPHAVLHEAKLRRKILSDNGNTKATDAVGAPRPRVAVLAPHAPEAPFDTS